MTSRSSSIDKCPVCSSEQLSYFEERQVWICDECSIIVPNDGNMDFRAEELDSSVSSNGNSKSHQKINWQEQISIADKSEKNLVEVLSLTEDVGKELDMDTEQIVRAAEIVTKAWSANWMHGRTMKQGVAASIYLAGRKTGTTIPPGEIAGATNLESNSVKSSYVNLKDELEIDLEPPDPSEYVEFIVRTLDLPSEVSSDANSILHRRQNIGGNPIGIAGGAVYLADAENRVTLKEIAKATHLTKETIWKHSNRL